MPRRPVDQLAKELKPQGRDGIWTAIRAHKGDFTVSCLCAATDIPAATTRDYLNALCAAQIIGVVRTDTKGPIITKTYRLVLDVGAETPRIRKDGVEVTQGRGVEAMWRTIKLLNSFTTDELALTASTAKVTIKKSTAADYLNHMCHAGYVRRNGKRYSFVRSKDPGPLAPQIQRVKQVFDPNSKTVVWPKGDAS